ncbi:cellulose biosynthesis protein BcsE [Brenneria izadpanahii]|uniref:Cellulose biosynthesis protein BcsE n=1 Tax=Brenneria izadpanahii TaxID=2722756 RepID=A0ABX7UXB5_9GAMM|nr:cellulose biosynthesis protein BcsE [Brenneria izadpanahii]QTF10454.1 cellulose biosynthesis protein BcsE [Brenneria izadpanahii]
MTQSFSLGVRRLGNELSLLQSPGFYWVNIERESDATLFCQQLISAQTNDTRMALICCEENNEPLFTPLFLTKLKQTPYYILPEKKAALFHFTNDLMRVLKPKARLLVFYTPAGLWSGIGRETMQRWMSETGEWLRRRQCTLIVLNHGDDIAKLNNTLISQHRALYGLASLYRRQNRVQYSASWWGTENGITANQTRMLEPETEGWRAVDDGERPPAPLLSDEGWYLAEKSVLEGAPALSENWRVFNENQSIIEQGMSAYAATLIFALHNPRQVENLARQIHRLRRRRGEMLKIVVREMKPALRSSDERLLLACGVNTIVAHTEPLSRFLSRLESVQGQRFTKHIPADIEPLLIMTRPLNVKGYLPPDRFAQSVKQLMSNTMIPAGSKGLLVALRPVSGLLAAQALTLCSLRRFGDVITISQGRLLLFLFTCRMNELDMALKSIFRLPVDEIFSNRIAWSRDAQVLSAIDLLSADGGGGDIPPINNYVPAGKETPLQKEQIVRRRPVAISLFAEQSRENTC